jgi:hypothetical protein
LQRGALNRNAKHGQHGVRRNHPGEMRRAPRARDDHFDPARFGAGRELGHPHRCPVRGDDVPLVLDAELFEHIYGVLHRFPVRR